MSTEAAPNAVQHRIPKWEWADRVRRVRRDMRMSQDAFAEFLGIGAKRLGAWESGASEPQDKVEVAQLIEAKTGVPATWMLGLDSPNLISAPAVPLPRSNTGSCRRSGMRTRTALIVRHPVAVS